MLGFLGGIAHGTFVFVVVLIVLVIAIILFKIGYLVPDPDEALVISGRGKKPRFVIGTATWRIPGLEQKRTLTLRPINIDLNTTEWVPTNDYIGVKVNAVVNVKIDAVNADGTLNEHGLLLASQHYNGKSEAAIASEIKGTLEGNVREIIGQMSLKQMVTDRKMFGEKVMESAQIDMQRLGLVIQTFNVQSFTDKNGVIDALGVDNEAHIKKDAAVSAAENTRDMKIAAAQALKEANDAEVDAQTQIAERTNQLRKRKAELKAESDIEQAQADVAYQLEEEAQRADLERRTMDAELARVEKEIDMQERRVKIRERELDAETRKKAEADKYATEQAAEADLFKRTKEAEAQKLEDIRRAEAETRKAELEAEATKARAEAARYASEQEAAGIAALAEAEAAREREVGTAKAAALEKEAEAMEKLGQAALGKLMIEKMPEIAHEFAASMASIGDVTIIGGGNDSGIGSYMDAMPVAMSKMFATMKETCGLDMADIMMGDSKSAQTERNIHIDSDNAAKKLLDIVPDLDTRSYRDDAFENVVKDINE